MKKVLFVVGFVFTSILTFGQFRMVGSGSWTTINDSTYTANVTFAADLTGNGYLANQIQVGWRLFTGSEKLYKIDSVWNKTFSSAELRIIEIPPTDGAPVGQVMVFDPQGRNTIPQVPFGSSGSTAQLQAAVDTWNTRVSNIDVTYNGDSSFVNDKFVGLKNEIKLEGLATVDNVIREGRFVVRDGYIYTRTEIFKSIGDTIVKIANIPSGLTGIAGVEIMGDNLYVSTLNGPTKIYDISNPYNPVLKKTSPINGSVGTVYRGKMYWFRSIGSNKNELYEADAEYNNIKLIDTVYATGVIDYQNSKFEFWKDYMIVPGGHASIDSLYVINIKTGDVVKRLSPPGITTMSVAIYQNELFVSRDTFSIYTLPDFTLKKQFYTGLNTASYTSCAIFYPYFISSTGNMAAPDNTEIRIYEIKNDTLELINKIKIAGSRPRSMYVEGAYLYLADRNTNYIEKFRIGHSNVKLGITANNIYTDKIRTRKLETIEPIITERFVRNDSIFLKMNNGSDLFVNKVASSSSLKIGERVWYVSKQAGCSAAGKLGDPTQPFCSPSQALDSVQAGDLVMILPGDYTFGDINDPVDIPIDSANLNTTSLFRDGVTWYAYPGVRFVSRTSKVNRVLFYDSQGRKCSLLGHATLTVDTTVTPPVCCPPGLGNMVAMFALLDDTLSRFTLKADSVYLPYSYSNVWAKPFLHMAWKDVDYNIRNISSGGIGCIMFGTIDGPPPSRRIASSYRSKAVINVDRIRVMHSSPYGISTVFAVTNADIVFNYNTAEIDINNNQVFSFEGRGAVNTNVTVNINNMTVNTNTPLGSYNGLFYVRIFGGERKPDKNNITFNIKHLKTKARLFSPNGGSSHPDHDARYKINIDYVLWEGDSISFVNVLPFKYCKNPIEINICRLDNRSVNKAVVQVPNNSQWMMNYSGTIENGYIEFLGPGNNILFKNCTILPPAGVAPVKSSTAINVPFINCYSNSTVIDPNVTELIEPIVRHANVR